MKAFSAFKRKEFLNLGLFSLSLIPVILFIFVIVNRIHLPFDLEWGEGAGINQIYRILSADKLYGEPTIGFAPLVYTPFYYWLSSIAGGIFGWVTWTARLISVLASVGAAGMIAWLVIKETRNALAGWLAGALYLACFALSDGFYDLVRVDSLYILLLLISFFFLQRGEKPVAMSLAGLCIALGFFTKQSTLIVFLPLIAYYLANKWKSAWPLLPTILLGILVPFYWLNARTAGWFSYYILRLPGVHGYSLVSAVDFWVGDLLGPLGIAFGFGLFYVVFRLGGTASTENPEHDQPSENQIGLNSRDRGALHYLLFAVGAIGAAWITRASNGGGANNVMSAYAAGALLFGLGFDLVQVQINRMTEREDLYRALAYGLAAIQLIGLIYNPFNFIPTAEEVEANALLIDRMEDVEGPIWIPYRSHLPRLSGKETFIHAVNLFELTGYFKGNVLPEGREIIDQIQHEVCSQAYALIVLDQPIPWIEGQLMSAYQEDNSFSALVGNRRSDLLSWQGGFDAVFVPREGYDPSSCYDKNDSGGGN